MSNDEGVLYALIVGCEAAFWIVLAAGLATRYILQWSRLSRVLLICVPLVDIALLAFTVADLRGGAPATFAHGLATAYVAFTIVFGATMIRWADGHFAHRFAGAPAPSGPPTRGWAAIRYELKLWGMCLIAVAIIYALLLAITVAVGEEALEDGRLQGLEIWYRIPLGTIFFWFLFGPLWALLSFKRASAVRSGS